MGSDDSSLGGIVSARLGSVSSRMSDSGRILGHGDALTDSARGSEKEPLPSMPPTPRSSPLSESGDCTVAP